MFLPVLTSAQSDNKNNKQLSDTERLVIMQPTGNIVHDLPEMRIISNSLPISVRAHEIMNSSYMNEAIEMYYLASRYHVP